MRPNGVKYGPNVNGAGLNVDSLVKVLLKFNFYPSLFYVGSSISRNI